MTDRPPDEIWVRGDSDERYWRPSTVGDRRTEWIVVHGAADPPQPVQDAPRRPPVVPLAIAATPDPTPIPVTRRERIRNLMAALRLGDSSAVHPLRAALRGSDEDDAA